MSYWLFKEEPEHYNYADLEKDKTTFWNGVHNNLAKKNLCKVKRGDRIWFYHTGKEKAVVGEMRADSDAMPDPADPGGFMVKVTAVRRLSRPVTLAQIKEDSLLAGWDLARLPRLSVVPLTGSQWARVERLSTDEK